MSAAIVRFSSQALASFRVRLDLSAIAAVDFHSRFFLVLDLNVRLFFLELWLDNKKLKQGPLMSKLSLTCQVLFRAFSPRVAIERHFALLGWL